MTTLLLYISLLALTDRQNDRQRDKYTHCAWAGGTFFRLCCCVSFWFWQEIGFGFIYFLCTQSTIQLWCRVSFLVLAGNSFLCYIRTQITMQLCGCVSFLVVAGNSSQNENTYLQKNLLGYFFMICQPMCVFHKTYHSFTLNLSILYISLVPRGSTS